MLKILKILRDFFFGMTLAMAFIGGIDSFFNNLIRLIKEGSWLVDFYFVLIVVTGCACSFIKHLLEKYYE